MTNKQIEKIEALRNQGKSWKTIAAILHYPSRPDNLRETYRYHKETYDIKRLHQENRFYSIHVFGTKPTAFKEVA